MKRPLETQGLIGIVSVFSKSVYGILHGFAFAKLPPRRSQLFGKLKTLLPQGLVPTRAVQYLNLAAGIWTQRGENRCAQVSRVIMAYGGNLRRRVWTSEIKTRTTKGAVFWGLGLG